MSPGRASAVSRLLLITLFAAWAIDAAAAEDDHYLLTLSSSRPPCSGADGAGSDRRCFGTRPDVTRVEMPLGPIVYLETRASVPEGWVFAGPLLLHAGNFSDPGRGYRFRQGASGLRLEIYRDQRMLSTLIELDRWLPAQTPDDEEIWVRVSRVR